MPNPIERVQNLDSVAPTPEPVQEQKAYSKEKTGKNPKLWIGKIMKKVFVWWREISPYGWLIHRVFSLLLSWGFVSGLYFIASGNLVFNIWSLYLAFFVASFAYSISLLFIGLDRPKFIFGENLFRYLCLVLLACYAILSLSDNAAEVMLFNFEFALTLAVFLLGVMDGFTLFHPRISRKPDYLEGLTALCTATLFGFFASLSLLKLFETFFVQTSVNL